MKQIKQMTDPILSLQAKPKQFLSASIAAIILSSCGGGGGGDSGGNPPQSNNSPPSVTADERMIVSAGDAVTVTASATDPDADSISYQWTQQNGDAVANTQGFTTSSASFSAPDKVQTIVFQVTATAAGQSDSTTVQVIVLEDVDTAVFIDADFTGTSDGSIDAPLTDLEAALTDSPDGTDFYIQTLDNNASYALWENPSFIPSLRDGSSVYGAYSDDWSRDTISNLTPITAQRLGLVLRDIDQVTTVSGLDLTVTLDPDNITATNTIGVYADNGSSEFILENNKIHVEGFPGVVVDNLSAGSVYGFYANSVDTVSIATNTVVTGNGLATSNRDIRTSGEGDDGNAGGNSNVGDNQIGGSGGSGTGGRNGGKGGDAGRSADEKGDNGEDGNGRDDPYIAGGGGGLGGLKYLNEIRYGFDGVNGGFGRSGIIGDGATGFGALSGDVYTSSQGSDGSDGYAGAGGGGGGGGAASEKLGVDGGAGGGGGEGGDGGSSGFGAYSGGASIALHIAGPTMSNITGNTLTSGNGATGGIGGAGSSGGEGGEGGEGVNGNLDYAGEGRGGDGGKGGTGGRGGAAGSGAGGPSFGIFIGANTPANIDNNVITTGNGGSGGEAFLDFESKGAGNGGWTVGIFDGDNSDGLTPVVSNNTITLGLPGQDGNPKDGEGTAVNTNF
jgi:hypothetical protein